MADIIDRLIEDPISTLRLRRPIARKNAQRSFDALMIPSPGLPMRERVAVAFAVAVWHDEAVDFYRDIARQEFTAPELKRLQDIVERSRVHGPYGNYREPGLQKWNKPGGWLNIDAPPRLQAAIEFAHLLVFHPRDSRAQDIHILSVAGFNEDEVVTLAELITFLCFQLRIVHGLRRISGRDAKAFRPVTVVRGTRREPTGRATFDVNFYPDLVRPKTFVMHQLNWCPWVPPVEKEDLTQDQRDAIVDPERLDMPYFRLLARDSQALKARTLTGFDIFNNTDGGVGRGERELAATVASLVNGSAYCVSVHSVRAVTHSGRTKEIKSLLRDGPHAALSTPEWSALRDAAISLTQTPLNFSADSLMLAGFDTLQIVDIINSTAYFNWANRLMLGLGEPEVPPEFRADEM